MLSNNKKAGRRAFLAGAAALLLVPSASLALSPDQASALVNRVMSDTLKVVNSGASEGQALSAFQRTLVQNSEMSIIARSVLGQPWRAASNAQKSAFINAFSGYVSRKYGREFRSYRGASFEISGATDRGNKGVVVNTSVNVPGSGRTVVDWQVIEVGGAPKVFDLLIEGISMIGTERSEVRAIYEANRSNLDATIADLGRRG